MITKGVRQGHSINFDRKMLMYHIGFQLYPYKNTVYNKVYKYFVFRIETQFLKRGYGLLAISLNVTYLLQETIYL